MSPSPIECLSALYDVSKQASMSYDDHAKAQVYFQTVRESLNADAGEAEDAKRTDAVTATD